MKMKIPISIRHCESNRFLLDDVAIFATQFVILRSPVFLTDDVRISSDAASVITEASLFEAVRILSFNQISFLLFSG
jgi:hypothetical protein